MCGQPGMRKRAPMHSGQARQAMWQSMRTLRKFTIADIVATAEVSYSHAKKYVRGLADAGYLRCIKEKDSGRTGGHALWSLVKDTGPYAPRISKVGIRDPNLWPHTAETTVTIPRSEYERALTCVRACQGMTDPEREVAELKRKANS